MEGLVGTNSRNFQQALADLSVDKNNPKGEWRINEIEYIKHGAKSETCLCHHPIRRVCHLYNTQNDNETIVGECCFPRFRGETAFKDINKIFAALEKITKNLGASANREFIQFAYSQGIIDQDSCDLYLQIYRQRTLSSREKQWKIDLNREILAQTKSATRSRTLPNIQERNQKALGQMTDDASA